MTDYTKLAKEWVDKVWGVPLDDALAKHVLYSFATFLNERASREECEHGRSYQEDACTQCRKPHEKPCCEKCYKWVPLLGAGCSNPNCPCHRKEEKPCEHTNTFVSVSTKKGRRKICNDCNAVLPKATPSKAECPYAGKDCASGLHVGACDCEKDLYFKSCEKCGGSLAFCHQSTPSKALEYLHFDRLQTHAPKVSFRNKFFATKEYATKDALRAVHDKLNEVIRYVKELERKINT